MSIVALDLGGTPPATSRMSLVSASGKRMHPRVDLPLDVQFDDGRVRRAVDWSISGFSLSEGEFAAPEGTIHRVRLSVPLNGCAITVDADAKVTRAAGSDARGFRFVGLSPERARIIDHFIQSGIDGDAAVVGGLAVERGVPGGHRPEWRRRLLRNAGQAVKLLILAGVVIGGAGFVGARVLTVTTDYAAISADLQQLRAAETGYLVADDLTAGSRVRKGQEIGAIRPVAGPQMRLSTETQLAALQSGLEQQEIALEQARAGFTTFLQSARIDQVEALANRQMLELQVEAENKTYQRLLSLKSKDVVGAQRIDQEQQVLLGLQRSLSAARGAEEAARQKLANAEAGRFASDGRTTQKSPADIEQDIRATQGTIGRLRAMLAGLDTPLPVVSPCDCIVASLAATPGAFVQSGARIADLVADGSDGTTLDALVQNARLNLVRAGQEVTVYLADRPDGVSGHVEAVNFNPSDTGRAGLPAQLRTLDDYGLMTVRLDAPIADPQVGLPASVMAPIGWSALSANMPAIRWARNVFDAVAARVPAFGAGEGDPVAAGKAGRLPPQLSREPV